jgi:hypothetical protein
MTAGVQWNVTRSTPEQLAAARRVPDEELCPGSYRSRRNACCSVCGQHMGRLNGREDDVAARHRAPAWLLASGRELERQRAGGVGRVTSSLAPHSNGTWRPDEDALLKRRYERGDLLKAIAAEFGVSWAAVQQRVHVLIRRGQIDISRRAKRPWTEADEQELRGLVGWHAEDVIARKMGRSVNAIHVRINRLGLSRQFKGAYTAREVGRIFQVDAKTVSHIWIRHGWLQGKRSTIKCGGRRKWWIEHEAIEAFMRAHPHQYERRRIIEPYWRKIADAAWSESGLIALPVAAKKLRVCDETIKRRIRSGEWSAVRIPCGGGFQWFVKAEDLDRFRYWKAPVEGLIYQKGHAGAIGKRVVA